MQELGFSWWWRFNSRSSGLWCHAWFTKALVSYHHTTEHHILEGLDLNVLDIWVGSCEHGNG